MMRLCIFVGMTVGGIIGSVLADNLFGWVMLDIGSLLLSALGSIVGVFAGWKIARKLEE
jgi:predicted MFS family arabinose efflux permease